jgi:hypothetical protein
MDALFAAKVISGTFLFVFFAYLLGRVVTLGVIRSIEQAKSERLRKSKLSVREECN